MNNERNEPIRVFAICQVCGKKESYASTPMTINSCSGCGTEKAKMTCTSDPEEAEQIVNFIKTYSNFYDPNRVQEKKKADFGEAGSQLENHDTAPNTVSIQNVSQRRSSCKSREGDHHMKANVLARTSGISHDEWLEIRRQGIGGSDASAILGLNPYSSAFNVYMDKLGLASQPEETEAMWLGSQLEPIIAERFEQLTNMDVQRRNAIYQHPEYPWMLANIDRWIVGCNAGLEIKTTNMLNRSKFSDGEIPANYYIQCVHYMAVTGADEWYLAVAVLNRAFHVFHVERNETEIESLIEAEREFWEEHVMKRNPPDPDGSERAGELIKSLYPTEKKDAMLVPLFGIEEKLERLQVLKSDIKVLEKEADAIEQYIQLEIGEADGGRAQGYTIWWRTQERNAVDTTRLKKEDPDTYSKFLKTTAYRKFEVKKEA